MISTKKLSQPNHSKENNYEVQSKGDTSKTTVGIEVTSRGVVSSPYGIEQK